MLTLDSRHLNEELHRVRELSLTDELTSLPNRRAFMTRVEEEVARVERYGMPLSLAIIDLDSFKRVNDEYGHAAGDEVLRCYATQIFSVFRNHDLVARYGARNLQYCCRIPITGGLLRLCAKPVSPRRACGVAAQKPLFQCRRFPQESRRCSAAKLRNG